MHCSPLLFPAVRQKYDMEDRSIALRSLFLGDIFHAASPNGASLICLVTSIAQDVIIARTVTSQLEFQFDRITGLAEFGAEKVPCSINSVAALPAEIHQIMLGLDRKFRFETDMEKLKLTKDEIRGLVFVGEFYEDNQL